MCRIGRQKNKKKTNKKPFDSSLSVRLCQMKRTFLSQSLSKHSNTQEPANYISGLWIVERTIFLFLVWLKIFGFVIVDPFSIKSVTCQPKNGLHTHTSSQNKHTYNNVWVFQLGRNWTNWFHITWHWLNFNSREPTINLADWRVIIVYKQNDKLI